MFRPPFCPYRACVNHLDPPGGKWWYANGTHDSHAFGKVPRFKCKHCRRTFSVQTFRVTYYSKRVLPMKKLERLSSSSMSTRALSREFRCSCNTITNWIDRIARQGIMLHAALRKLIDPHDSVCFDGLVSFESSQYFPNDIGISITCKARMILGLSHAITRRAVERSFGEHLDMLRKERSITLEDPLVVITDEKVEYKRAFRKHELYKEQDEATRCVHLTVSSKFPRTYSNPLFPSNYIDREARKDQANFRRETTCYSRNGANCMSRLSVYAIWHNYAKKYLVKKPIISVETHAEVAGVERRLIRSMRRRMFSNRAFLSRLNLPPLDSKIWTKTVYSPWAGKEISASLPHFAFG